eukprot:3260850-Prymnesium_polylepis.1
MNSVQRLTLGSSSGVHTYSIYTTPPGVIDVRVRWRTEVRYSCIPASQLGAKSRTRSGDQVGACWAQRVGSERARCARNIPMCLGNWKA